MTWVKTYHFPVSPNPCTALMSTWLQFVFSWRKVYYFVVSEVFLIIYCFIYIIMNSKWFPAVDEVHCPEYYTICNSLSINLASYKHQLVTQCPYQEKKNTQSHLSYVNINQGSCSDYGRCKETIDFWCVQFDWVDIIMS